MNPGTHVRALPRSHSPRIHPWVHAFLVRYANWMLRRQFQAIRLARCGPPPRVSSERPLIIYLNHTSWWDPLVALWLAERFLPDRHHYGPMEAAQLRRYGILRHIGIFGVEKGLAGARGFLETSKELLARPGAVLWLTPQGRFVDVRERPVRFAPGLLRLMAQVPEALCVSLALEFGFAKERLPEIRIRFGPALSARALSAESQDLGAGSAIERELQSNQEALARIVCADVPGTFETLSHTTSGVSLPYDLWRRIRSACFGGSIELNHSGS